MSRTRIRRWSVLRAEVSLVAVTLATVVGFGRLFDDGSFGLRLGLAALAAHVLAALTRHRGWGLPSSVIASSVALVVALTWLFYPDTTAFGIPISGTGGSLATDLETAWGRFGEVVAPAPVETGFLVALAVALWVAAFLADWAAFRIWSPMEAVVPASALFAFSSLLGADEHRVASAGIFSFAVGAFLLTHRVAEQATTPSWIGGNAARGGRSLLVAGTTLALTSVTLGVLVGPALPGAKDPAALGWRELESEPGARVTLSPMVSIRSRLVEQADVELFTVETHQRSYWRLTSLDTFDGEIWKSRGDYDDVRDRLPSGLGSDIGTESSVQRYTIESLSSLWLPAAFEPRRIDAPGVEVVYEESSSTLIVGNEHRDSDGTTYTVESALPRFEPDALRTALGPVPTEVADRYLQLPPGLGDEVAVLASEITAGAESPYDRALALQDWFRRDFTYDLDVAAGHDIDSIESFLEVRRGYCEQFAGTFAAMARTLGIPARVAVGFTSGEQDAVNPNLWHVTGRQAHAWPEVYLSGAGWVGFEPTPGRGAPSAEVYTGVPEQQEGDTWPFDQAATTTTAPETTTSEPAHQDPEPGDLADAPGAPGSGAGTGNSEGGRWRGPAGGAILVIALALTYAGGVILLKGRRARRRRDAATTHRALVSLAWVESAEDLAGAGLRLRPSETHAEFAQRVTARLDVDPAALARLAQLGASAEYAGSEPTESEVAEAGKLADEVRSQVADLVRLRTRVAHLLDPRPLLRPRSKRLVSAPALTLRTGRT